LKRKILEFVQRTGYKPLKAKSLAKRLGVTKKNQAQFQAALQSLMESGELREGPDGRLRPRMAAGLLVGIVKRTSRGTGVFIPHDADEAPTKREILIAAADMRDAHTGDEVLVRLLKRRGAGGRRCGRIEQILERATNQFVGTYFEAGGSGYVQVVGKTFTEPILVGDPGAKGAKPGDKVVVEMLRYPSQTHSGEAVITKVLGPQNAPGVDELSITHEFGLRDEFPEEVLEDARRQAQQFDETHLDGRVDLTKEIIVTIDPADARDFDDAISLTRSRDGHWHLGVHIADVSHFVESGSALDREARLRGNSVYLPGRVLPMLPELISNGLASLQQGRVRYTKSVLIEFTPEGIPVHTEFARSAIRVTRRFAYEQVMAIIEQPERFRTRVSAKVRKLLAMMYELAMILRRRRLEAGALELDVPEIELEYDDDGRVVGAHAVEHDESHQIIEEFMLAANMAVAQELDDRGIPFMRRAHGAPNPTKLKAFAQFVSALGYKLERYQSRFELQKLLNQVKGKPAESAVNYALLRSMKQAEYTGEPLGHYALAVENYCHFTSPIRRYPDLTVHRLIDGILEGRKRVPGPNELELTRLGKHCSLTERKADAAERELIKVKLLRYFADRIGEVMEAVITGVERYGLFCRGVDLPVEGFIHISWLSDHDNFYYDASSMSLVGRQSGRQYRLGDVIEVMVAHVDLDRRELDFALPTRKAKRRLARSAVEEPATESPPKKQPSERKTKRPTAKRSRRSSSSSRQAKKRKGRR